MDTSERGRLIPSFADAYVRIEKALVGTSPEARQYTPPIPEAWSINNHLVHLLDAEVAGFGRIRRAVAETGSEVQVWDEEAWQARLAYDKTDGLGCLALCAALRKTLAGFLSSLDQAAWEEAWIVHPERGRLSMPQLVQIYKEHPEFHEGYIRRNLDAFSTKGGR